MRSGPEGGDKSDGLNLPLTGLMLCLIQ